MSPFRYVAAIALLASLSPLAAGDERLRLTMLPPGDDTARPPVVTAVAISPDGSTIAAGGDDHRLCLWSASTGAPLHTLAAHGDWVRAITFVGDERLATVGADRFLRVWRLSDETPKLLHKSPAGAVLRAIAAHPAEERVACVGFDNRLREVSLAAPASPRERVCVGADNRAVAYSPDGRWVAAAGRDGVVRMWDTVASGGPRDLPSDGRRVHALAFSPDGETLAAGGDGPAVRLWRLDGGVAGPTPDELLIRPGKVHALAFVSSTTLAVGGTGDGIVLWNTDTASPRRTLRGHTGAVASLAASADGSMLVSGSFDTTVRVWETEPAAATTASRKAAPAGGRRGIVTY